MPNAARIATANVHVLGDDGHVVVLRRGDRIPADLFHLVGSHVYETAESDVADVATPEATASSPADFDADDIQSLRAAAKSRGLSGAGSKKDLAARIAEHDGQ